jgi:hypothetical protein
VYSPDFPTIDFRRSKPVKEILWRTENLVLMKWKENDSRLKTFYRDGIWKFWIVRSNESKKSATTCELNNISTVELDYNVMK